MTIWINVNYEGWFAEFASRNNGRGISRRGKRLLLTEPNRRAVAYWQRKIIPRHFEPQARSRYHYKRRKQPYRRIKVAIAGGEQVFVNGQAVPTESIRKGGRVDIVRSGRTERKAEQIVPIRATPNSAVATLRVPRHIVSRARANRPNQANEIRSTTKAERGRMVTIWRKTFLAGVRVYGSSIVSVRRRIQPTSAFKFKGF